MTPGSATVWSQLSWDALEQALLVTNDVFLQGLALVERNGRTVWWPQQSFRAGKLG